MNSIRKLFSVLLSLGTGMGIFLAPVSPSRAQETNAVPKVSISDLLQNKERWKGKAVEVHGFFVSRFEARALYENQADSNGMHDDRSLWIDFPDKATTEKGKLKWVRQGFVRIIGTFDFQPGKGSGHLGQWPAKLRNIELVEPVPTPEEPKRGPAPG